MSEEEPVLDYRPPPKNGRRVWPWYVGAMLVMLGLLYAVLFWYLNTFGS